MLSKLKERDNLQVFLSITSVLIILFLTIGFSAFGDNLFMNNIALDVRQIEDIRVTGIEFVSATEGVVSTNEDYNIKQTMSTITFPSSSSSVTYKIQVTNFGTVDMGILDITGLPEEFTYTLEEYKLKDKICDDSGLCHNGAQKEFLLIITNNNSNNNNDNPSSNPPKPSGPLYQAVSTGEEDEPKEGTYYIELIYDFRRFQKVTYIDIDNTSDLPKEVLNGDMLVVDFGSNAPTNVDVKMGDNLASNYTYKNGVLKVPNVLGDVIVSSVFTEKNFDYNSSCGIQSFIIPKTGVYKLEVWGAQGGNYLGNGTVGGKGGYSVGFKTFTEGDIVYVGVGGKGTDYHNLSHEVTGGCNGGATGWDATGGGGATHIASVDGNLAQIGESGIKNETIYIVAGGGSGAYKNNGAAGGGIYGVDGTGGTGGSQNTGGVTGYNFGKGSFGQGGTTQNVGGSGGGGGLYGGSFGRYGTGGGGSGYIGGVVDYKEDKDQTIAGNSEIPTIDGTETEIGHTGNGYAKITYFSEYNTVTYIDIDDTDLPKEVITGTTLVVDFKDKAPKIISVRIDYKSIEDYTYDYKTGILTIPDVFGNITITANKRDYEYTEDIQRFVVPRTGIYKLEVWGAQGGNSGGKGGYSIAFKSFTEGDIIYLGVGGAGVVAPDTGSEGGFNGGGYAASGGASGGTGGGATHMATEKGLLSELSKKQDSVLIVAGGGGGRYNTYIGGVGGGVNGGDAKGSCNGCESGGGTQSAGGSVGSSSGSKKGTFGKGGDKPDSDSGSGGGGGFYGGGGGSRYSGGGGGSGYIGDLGDYNGIIAQTIAGNEDFPTIDGTGTEIGHEGNGYAKITYVSNINTITYENIDDAGLPKEVTTGNDLVINFKDDAPGFVIVKQDYRTIENYTYNYKTRILTIPNIMGNITIIGNKKEYGYTGEIQTFKITTPGIYKLEVWGAQGGNSGGKGGYSVGFKSFVEGDIIYLGVGGAGVIANTETEGGFNGGGNAIGSSSQYGTGGGATHMATVDGTLTEIGATGVTNGTILIVAGGGGGKTKSYAAGVGGGLTGGDSKGKVNGMQSTGGTQTSGGSSYQSSASGFFGHGGNHPSNASGSGGGGGLYGGGRGTDAASGAGGSGYIGGVVSYGNITAETIAGNEDFPTIDGTGTETGHIGNGFARITFIE